MKNPQTIDALAVRMFQAVRDAHEHFAGTRLLDLDVVDERQRGRGRVEQRGMHEGRR